MSSRTCPVSFSKLLEQYVPGSYLVETKHGSEFRKPRWRMFRCLEHIFAGSSFSIEKSAPPLLQRAKEFLDNKEPPLEELESLTKILFLMRRIFYGASFFRRDELKEFQQLYTQEKSLATRALQALAKRRNLSELALCLELGKTHALILEEAYKKANEGASIDKLSQEQLNLLATVAWEKDDTTLLLRAITLGGTPPISSKKTQHAVLRSLLLNFDDKTLASLIRHGYDCKIDIEESSMPFGLACVKYGMNRTVQAMIDKNIPLNSMRDADGNCPLHYAFLIGNIELARMLCQVVDPTIKNNDGETPLSCLLHPSDVKAQNLRANNTDIKRFLRAFFENTEDNNTSFNLPKGFLSTIKRTFPGGNLLPARGSIELVFLLNNNATRESLFQKIKITDLDLACEALRTKYQKDAVEKFCLFSFSIQDEHYKAGCDSVSFSEKVEGNPEPWELLTLLDELRTFSSNDRNKLKNYLEKVRRRFPFYGTPPAGTPALKDFYKTIETNLKHIIFSLRQKKDPALTTSVLKEFIDAESLCGGRYYAVSWQQALSVCLGLSQDPRSNIERSLALFRSMCLEGTVQTLYPNNNHNVHVYNTALRDFGKLLGIPGCTDAKTFNDVYEPDNYNAEAILNSFRKAYTPYSLIHDWILPALREDPSFRNDYITLQKTLVPKDWSIPDLEGEPTEEEKAYDFLGKFVYNENNELRPSAVRYLLEQLGVITCKLI